MLHYAAWTALQRECRTGAGAVSSTTGCLGRCQLCSIACNLAGVFSLRHFKLIADGGDLNHLFTLFCKCCVASDSSRMAGVVLSLVLLLRAGRQTFPLVASPVAHHACLVVMYILAAKAVES